MRGSGSSFARKVAASALGLLFLLSSSLAAAPALAWGSGGGGGPPPKAPLKGSAINYKGRFRWNGHIVTITFGEKSPTDSSEREWKRDPNAPKDQGFPGMEDVKYHINNDPKTNQTTITIESGHSTNGGPVDGMGHVLDNVGNQFYGGGPAQISNPIPITFY